MASADHHYERAIIHIHPVSAANKLIRGVLHEGTVGIGTEVRLVKAAHGGNSILQERNIHAVPFTSELSQVSLTRTENRVHCCTSLPERIYL
jgi:hypothetical protein